jgi:hypothetical protein
MWIGTALFTLFVHDLDVVCPVRGLLEAATNRLTPKLTLTRIFLKKKEQKNILLVHSMEDTNPNQYNYNTRAVIFLFLRC